MTVDQVLAFYGSAAKAARALGLERQAIRYWKTTKKVPPLRQRQLQDITKGALIADPDVSELLGEEAA